MTVHEQRLSALRKELTSRGLDGFIVPLTDEHMSEYVGEYAQRLPWLTNFTGSAGNAVILMDKAAVFVDGRYTIQVAAEVDTALFEHHHFQDYPLLDWIKDEAPEKAKIGYDPELTTITWEESAKEKLETKGLNLVPVLTNPIDTVWAEQAEPPHEPAVPHPDEYTGKSSQEKRSDLAAELKKKGANAVAVTMLDSVAWLFNIRGADVACTPVARAFAILNADNTATLYIDDEKVTDALKGHLGPRVSLASHDAFYGGLEALGKAGKTVLVDRATNNARVFKTLTDASAKLIEGDDPCILPKAIKNTAEQEGTRAAHIRDGAAVSEFLCWIAQEAPSGKISELTAVAKLWACRQKQAHIRDRSFDTISGSGPNGAIVHYRVTEKTNKNLTPGELYLVDSGGQYLDGTTDITRTVAIGTPTDEMKDRFTRVLKGHIAIATARFPKGTPGQALDAMARRPLWDAGLDYDHGTGHGVGSYLGVHEGPQRISKIAGTAVPLKEGMILSNEPGYYKQGAYGIRIENLVLVTKRPGGERDMLAFENLTWAPIDRHLVKTALLNEPELAWLNDYHATVYEKISPLVNEATQAWLKEATAPISHAS